MSSPPWGHVAEWLRNGLQNRVLRFNSGRGLQLSQSTYKNTASATRGRCTLVDLFGQGHRALDATQRKRSRQFSEEGQDDTGVSGGDALQSQEGTLDHFVLCSKVLVLCGNYR